MKLKSFVTGWINIAILTCLLYSCSKGRKNYDPGVELVAGVVTNMTEIMVNDVTNSPLAARFFAYSMLTGYEVVSKNDASVKSF